MQEITILRDTATAKAGTVLRVWQSGPVEPGMVDPGRAAQWIADGIALAGLVEKVEAKTAKAAGKRGK